MCVALRNSENRKIMQLNAIKTITIIQKYMTEIQESMTLYFVLFLRHNHFIFVVVVVFRVDIEKFGAISTN